MAGTQRSRQRWTPLSGFQAADCILRDVAEDVENTDSEELLESILLPSIPEGVSLEEFKGWTASLVRQGIESIASHADRIPKHC